MLSVTFDTGVVLQILIWIEDTKAGAFSDETLKQKCSKKLKKLSSVVGYVTFKT